MSDVLFVGAGDLGLRTASALIGDGWKVFALRRNIEALPASLTGIRADLTNEASIGALAFPAVDAVVVCVTAPARTEQAYRAVYVDGVRAVFSAMSRQDRLPARVVFVSTTAVYAQNNGMAVDETSSTQPSRFNGVVMLEAEALAATSGATVTVAARLGGIYGPGRTALLDRVRQRLERVGPDVRDAYTNRIHVDDAASALAFVVTHPAPPSVINVVDDEPARRSDVVRFIAAEVGVPLEDTEGPRAGQETDDGLTRVDDKRVSNARLRALGFSCRYPTYREGYRALIAETSRG